MSASGLCAFCETTSAHGMRVETPAGSAFICYDCAEEFVGASAPEMGSFVKAEENSPEEEPF